MKNVILISVITLIIGLALILSDAVAEQRIITFEMGESGQTVSFPMSPEEIIFADMVAAYAKTLKNTGNTKRKKWVNRIELPESGQYLEFPMTDEEIRAEIKKVEQEKSNRNQVELNEQNDSKNIAEIVEMADGYTIVFYKDNTAKWGYYPIQ
jgi:hypothetical protein